jgi:hypothetical protein
MQTVGYLSNGGSDDWIYAHDPEHKTFSLTPEMGLTSEGFYQQPPILGIFAKLL